MTDTSPGSFSDSADEIDHEDLKWAVSHTRNCGSDRSCIKSGTCLGQPVCRPLGPLGKTAGFVVPTESAARCGYCTPSFNGSICFCPTRWALHRADVRQSSLDSSTRN